MEILSRPWPWYVAGPLIGLTVPMLLVLGNKQFGVSAGLRHMCAAMCPGHVEFFQYDWRTSGLWNLIFVTGIFLGGVAAAAFFPGSAPDISPGTRNALAALGVTTIEGLAPPQIFAWSSLLTVSGFVAIVIGGFLVGFGTAYAGGCTSGHAIAGLADFQLPSLIAVIGFFGGGLLTTFLILPRLFR